MRVLNYAFNGRVFSVLMVLSWFIISYAAAYQQYCKCECNSNAIIKPIEKCGLCTKDFCLQQDSKICSSKDGDGSTTNNESEEDIRSDAENNIIISCFQTESPKDAFIIYVFVAIVLGLLGYSVYRTYIYRQV